MTHQAVTGCCESVHPWSVTRHTKHKQECTRAQCTVTQCSSHSTTEYTKQATHHTCLEAQTRTSHRTPGSWAKSRSRCLQLVTVPESPGSQTRLSMQAAGLLDPTRLNDKLKRIRLCKVVTFPGLARLHDRQNWMRLCKVVTFPGRTRLKDRPARAQMCARWPSVSACAAMSPPASTLYRNAPRPSHTATSCLFVHNCCSARSMSTAAGAGRARPACGDCRQRMHAVQSSDAL